MTVETHHALKPRKVRGTDVKKGQPIYCIRKGDLYFIWCYTDRAFAEDMDKKLTGPTDELDMSANWRPHYSQLTPTDTKGK